MVLLQNLKTNDKRFKERSSATKSVKETVLRVLQTSKCFSCKNAQNTDLNQQNVEFGGDP